MYYAQINSQNKLVNIDISTILTDEYGSGNVQNIEVSEEVYNSYKNDNLSYIWNGSEIVVNPNYEEQSQEREFERVGELTMTALDFITFLRQCGLTLEQIRAYLSANIELDTQLTYCQNVYCKVSRSIMPITLGDITITAEMVEQAFKRKNGEE